MEICSGKKLSYNVQDLIEHPSSIGAANHDIALYDLVVTMELTGEQRGRIESQSSIVRQLSVDHTLVNISKWTYMQSRLRGAVLGIFTHPAKF